MPQREYSTAREKVARRNKRITVPIGLEQYAEAVQDAPRFRALLDEQVAVHPELFPAGIQAGYRLHDMRASVKLPEIRLRRIKVMGSTAEGGGQVYTIAPSGLLPYMTGYTDEVEKALFLRRFGVPFWALAYAFGQDEQYWYRLSSHFGRYELVATTVQHPTLLPAHLLADEMHVPFHGETAYLATTVGADCVLGLSLSLTADEPGLHAAYEVFAQEVQQVEPTYQPQTVNTDGWVPTHKAWRTLFPLVVLMECFLHAYLKIRERCRRLKESYAEIQRQVWEIYHAPEAQTCRQRVATLQAWLPADLPASAREAVLKLCGKVERFVLAFDYPDAYRTSNMIDRHMVPLARWVESTQGFHGNWASAERAVRAWALFHNFAPYCPRAAAAEHFLSPVHKLNGSVYHQNWLHNLLIATSRSRPAP